MLVVAVITLHYCIRTVTVHLTSQHNCGWTWGSKPLSINLYPIKCKTSKLKSVGLQERTRLINHADVANPLAALIKLISQFKIEWKWTLSDMNVMYLNLSSWMFYAIDWSQSEPCSGSCLHVYNLTCTNTILRKYPAVWMIIRMLRGAQIDMKCWSCWSVFKAAYEHTTYVTSLDLVTRSRPLHVLLQPDNHRNYFIKIA